MKNLIGIGCGLLASIFCFAAFAQMPPGVGGGGGTNDYSFTNNYVPPDYGTNLFVQMESVSNNAIGVSLHNSQPDVQFEILGKQTLLDTQWISQGFILGAEGSTSTVTSVSLPLTNSYFLQARSWQDSDGSGIPDWWQLQYFGTTGIDPYADPDGDGWNNLQEFQNGTNPNSFDTPPAPQGVRLFYNATTGAANVNWQSSSGTITGYTVTDSDGNTFNFSAATNGFVADVSSDTPFDLPDFGPTLDTTYQVQAHYANGDSALSDPTPLEGNTLSASIIPGALGSAVVAVSSMPANTVALRVTHINSIAHWDDGDTSAYDTNFEISVTTNGLYSFPNLMSPQDPNLPPNNVSLGFWFVQAVGADGSLSAATYGIQNYISQQDGWENSWVVPPYFDGRAQLKQNLIFLLRAGLVDSPFQFSDVYSGYSISVANPSDYVYDGFYVFDHWIGYYGYNADYDIFQPFEENYQYLNFVFNSSDLNSYGHTTTGVSSDLYNVGLTLDEPAAYQFQAPTTSGATISALLATNDTRWLTSYPLDFLNYDYLNYFDEIGITNDWLETGTNAMAGDSRNYWGLPFLSVKIAYSGGTTTLNAGGSTAANGYFYPETAQPKFETVEYDFWDSSPLPGSDGFATTNESDFLIASVGGSIGVNGYAKLALLNGYSGAYGYLAQYFDTAYKITNGIVTTNTTGVVSPYGNFFATEPGQAALVTMPDIDTGERGTCMVYCASLQLDANHDGNMDLSFNSADTTSQSKPMKFWINNDNDGIGTGQDINAPSKPDSANDVIQSMRDLEDFARLWVCGMPAIDSLGGYHVTLSWATISSGNPSIKIFPSRESDGGTEYLTDTNLAQYYVGNPLTEPCFGMVTNGSNFQFSDLYFTDGGDKHLMFEGVSAGEGELMLTITDGSGNTVAQTGVWIDLHDVKDFYERAVIVDNTDGLISTWSSSIVTVQHPTATISDEDSNIIVFVHGINVDNVNWRMDSDTVFKRLYWAGYQGKFATVKWPCDFLTPPQPFVISVFNESELKAYKASSSLKNYLSGLHTRFPSDHLNLLVHSQGNAVASEAIEQGAPFDTYILTQGALPANAYDASATNDDAIVAFDTGSNITPEWQPMGYHGVYTNLNGRMVNFYNPQDAVLGDWIFNQKHFKPSPNYFYDGTNSWNDSLGYNILVTDPQESRSMISRSRSDPIGREGPTSGQITQGVIASAIDLNAQFGFNGNTTDEHSAQWTRPIQMCWGYYDQILESCLIPTIQR